MRIFKGIRINIVNTHDEVELGVRPKKFQKNQSSTPIRKTKLFHPVSHKTHISSSFNSSYQKVVKQNCSVIAKYRNDKKGHLTNLEYIQKEGKSIDGEKPELYGSEINEEEYKKQAVEKNWRIILSPQSNNIDLNVLAKEFIERLETETGYKLTWIAANHYDTDNHHTHLIINGIDKNGKNVNFLPREKVSQLFREYSQNICTQMIGYRKQSDIDKDYERMTEKNYYTKLDRTLNEYIDENMKLSKNFMNSKRYENLIKRLDYLKSLNLCEYEKEKGTYKFKKEWKDELKILGKYNTYYDGYQYLSCNRDEYKIHEIYKDGPVSGKIKKIYTMQKNSNNFAVVLETKDGKGLYVPLNFYPDGCKNDDIIRIEMKNKKQYINNYSRKK